MFYANIGDKPAGYMEVQQRQPTQEDPSRVYVGVVYADDAFRRRGVSTKLHSEAFKWAAEKGVQLGSGMLTTKESRGWWKKHEALGNAVKVPGSENGLGGVHYVLIKDPLIVADNRAKSPRRKLGIAKVFDESKVERDHGKFATKGGSEGGTGDVSQPPETPKWGAGVYKTYDENLHPRDDHGRFISKGDIEEAKVNPIKAEELRAKTTDVGQRNKLNLAILNTPLPPGKGPGYKQTKEQYWQGYKAKKIAELTASFDNDPYLLDVRSQLGHAIAGTLDPGVVANLLDAGVSDPVQYYHDLEQDLQNNTRNHIKRLEQDRAYNEETGVLEKHSKSVQRALKEGKEVPEHILQQYQHSSWFPPSKHIEMQRNAAARTAQNDTYAADHFAPVAVAKFAEAAGATTAIHAAVLQAGEEHTAHIRQVDKEQAENRNLAYRFFDAMQRAKENAGEGKGGVPLLERDPDNPLRKDYETSKVLFDFYSQRDAEFETKRRTLQAMVCLKTWDLIGKPGTPKTEIKWGGDTTLASAFVKDFFGKVLEADAHGPFLEVNCEALTTSSVYGAHRAYANGNTITIRQNETLRTIAHEVGHVVERQPGLAQLAKGFVLAHTDGTKHLGESYEVHEVYRPEVAPPAPPPAANPGWDAIEPENPRKFYSRYSTKWYTHNSSEVLSVGVEQLFADPVAFARLAPEHFKYTVGVLRGDIHAKDFGAWVAKDPTKVQL